MKLKKAVLPARKIGWQKRLLLFAVVAGLGVVLPPERAFSRYAAIVIDSKSGNILFSRNANSHRYPASLTKMMTLYLAFDALKSGQLELGQKLSVSVRAAGQTPSKLGLRAGDTITVENAILAMVSKSANDAATVIAEALADSEIFFAQQMTEKARSLGMKKTTFRNATGLPNRRQRSTAHDIARLAQALLHNHSDHYHYFATRKFRYNGKVFDNHNNLLNSYRGTDGIKTGYIRASGFNVAASVERDGLRLIGVVFGGRTAKSRDKHVRRLFDRAFSLSEAKTIPKPTIKPITLDVPKPQIAKAAPAEANAPEQGSTDDKKTKLQQSRIKPALSKMLSKITKSSDLKWAIQIGAFRKKRDAYSQVVKATKIFPSGLKESTISVSPVRSRGRQLFRARMTKMTKSTARQACAILLTHAIPCNTMSISDS